MSELAAIRDYFNSIERKRAAGTATEHTYRSDLEKLLQALVPSTTATNEPKRRIDCGAPDYVITKTVGSGPLTVGYVEAKDVGLSLTEVLKTDQLKRYLRSLDNLVLTDYLEFRWFVNGEHRLTASLATQEHGHLR